MREQLVANVSQKAVAIKPYLHRTLDVSIKSLFHNPNQRQVSIEICPDRKLDTELLASIRFSFCSVTWRTPTELELQHVDRIPAILLAKQLRSHGYKVLLHLTGRNLNIHQVQTILHSVKDAGIRNIFALQGDPSEIRENDDKKCDFPYASDLVRYIRKLYGKFFTIGVAGYPEKHPDSENMEKDLEHLKYKVSCGADFVITQACHEFDAISSFVRRCRSIGIEVPIIPGIFIIGAYKTLTAMSKFCRVSIPENVRETIEPIKDDDVAVMEFGITRAKRLMHQIFNNDGIVHVFSLNNLELLRSVLSNEEFEESER